VGSNGFNDAHFNKDIALQNQFETKDFNEKSVQ
jgi:hypothetical protein